MIASGAEVLMTIVLRIVSGSANPGLASGVANHLGVESDGCNLARYPTGSCVRRSKTSVVPMFTPCNQRHEDDPALTCCGHNRRESVVEQHNVSRFTRHLGAPPAHRDADVGLGQGRRVVDAVADHRDDLALALEKADQIELLLRVDPRKDALSCDPFACGIGRVLQARKLLSGRHGRVGPRDANIAGDGQRRARMVAGSHRNTYSRAAK
jgi:hypothetical protein